jgi:hypothetical protein
MKRKEIEELARAIRTNVRDLIDYEKVAHRLSC